MVHAQEMARAEALYNAGLPDSSKVALMALSGGECLRCGVPWKAIKVKNEFAEFAYYQPACKCYPICRATAQLKFAYGKGKYNIVDHGVGCGRRLYEEWHGGVKRQLQEKGGVKQYRNVLTCSNCDTVVALTEWRKV